MRELFVGRYRSPVPIRCRGALHFYSVADPQSGRLQLLVMAPRVPGAEARGRLANLARLHRLVAGPRIPNVAEEALDGPTPWIALDCDAVADADHVTESVRHGGEKVDFKRGSALGKMIMESLIACHRVRDPESQQPVCLGSIASGNLFFAADGRMWLIGFGAAPLNNAFIAPEVASGSPATPGADVYAVTLFMRAQLEFVRMPPIMRWVFAGRARPAHAKVALLWAWSNLKVLAAPAQKRPDMQTGFSKVQALWRLLGFEPDVDGFSAWVARAIADDSERLADLPRGQETPGIVVGGGGEWLKTPGGARHALGTRRPLRRLLVALAEARRDRPGEPLAVDALLQAGWPGEDPLPDAGANRVYVAISSLRKLGLGELLQRWDGGYRLDPSVPCQFTA